MFDLDLPWAPSPPDWPLGQVKSPRGPRRPKGWPLSNLFCPAKAKKTLNIKKKNLFDGRREGVRDHKKAARWRKGCQLALPDLALILLNCGVRKKN